MKRHSFGALAGILLVCVVAISALPQTALALTDLGTFTYPTSTSLESVNRYAVFAQTYNKNNHMEGTIAADCINAGSDAFGVTSAVEQYVDKDEAFCYFAHVVGLGNMIAANTDSQGRDWNVIMPDDTTFDRSYNNGNGITISHVESGSTVSTSFNNATDPGKTVSHVSDTTYQIDFDEAFSDLTSYATALAARSDTGVTVSKEGQDDQNTRTIRVTCASGFDVVSISAADVRDNKIIVEGLDGATDYSLVINVTDVDTAIAYTMNRQITIDGNRTAYGAEGERCYGTSAPLNATLPSKTATRVPFLLLMVPSRPLHRTMAQYLRIPLQTLTARFTKTRSVRRAPWPPPPRRPSRSGAPSRARVKLRPRHQYPIRATRSASRSPSVLPWLASQSRWPYAPGVRIDSKHFRCKLVSQ